MKKSLIVLAFCLGILAFNKKMDDPERVAAVKKAIDKSLPVLQNSSHAFLKNVTALVNCHSCHNQGLGLVTFSMAREKGFDVSDSIVKEALDSTYNQWNTAPNIQSLMENDDPLAVLITGDYDLWALAENKVRSNKLIDILSQNIMRRQQSDGSWRSPGQRPPMEYYPFSVTALAVKNMQTYMPPVLKTEVIQRIAKAREWMVRTEPVAHEEKIFQLLGLSWSGGNKAFITQQAKKLLAAQQADGGWAQLETLSTDAYATGQALYALNQSDNLLITDTAFKKGIDFLLKNQEADGTWHIKSRSFPFVPYVDSGFPHKADQFISAAGTNWAVIALLLSVDKR